MQRTILKTLLLALLSCMGNAFVGTRSAKGLQSATSLCAVQENDVSPGRVSPSLKVATALTTAMVVGQPLVALAEQAVDDYEYGAVSAPPFIPIIGGILAILTALLPVFLRSGEEAFEEMKKTDSFGSGDDILKSRKK